jgi:hypothetical protein
VDWAAPVEADGLTNQAMSMHAIGRALPRPSARNVAGQTVAGLLVAAVAAGLTWFMTSHTTLRGVAAALVVAGLLWFAATRRTPLALALLMLYLGLLDGYLKLATGSNLVTFVRDALLYGIVVGLLVRATAQRAPLRAPPLSGWAFAFVVLVLVQLFNPHAGSLVHSLAGAREHLEFVPLFFLTYAFVRTTKALRIFVVLLLVIAAANGAVNWVQFHMTPQQLAAWGPGYAERLLNQGNFQFAGRTFNDTSGTTHTRPFGLGSEAGSGGIVAALAIGGVLAFASRFRRLRYLLFAVAMAIIATIAVVTSEGRGAIACSIAVALGFALLAAGSRGRSTTLLGVLLVAVLVAVVGQSIISGAGSSAFRYQGLTTTGILQTTEQARGRSLAKIPATLVDHPLGAGLGVGGPAAGVTGAPALAGVADAENEISFATLETGIPGMVTLIGFTAMLFVLGLRRCRNEPDPEARVLLAAIIAPIAGLLALYVVSAATPTTPAGPYLWACGGIVSYWLVTRPAARRSSLALGQMR